MTAFICDKEEGMPSVMKSTLLWHHMGVEGGDELIAMSSTARADFLCSMFLQKSRNGCVPWFLSAQTEGLG